MHQHLKWRGVGKQALLLKISILCCCVSSEGHKGQEVVAINPRGQVPAFKDGSVIVNESIAALFYLEQKYPNPSLMPTHLYPQVCFASPLSRSL